MEDTSFELHADLSVNLDIAIALSSRLKAHSL